MKFDLHMHSDASSDGQLATAELAAMAHEKGLEVIALSDHDSVENVLSMQEEAGKYGIGVIPALEITTSMGDQDVHLLGYGIDLNDPWINSLPEQARQSMDNAFSKRVKKLEDKYGLTLDEKAIREKAGDKNPWFTLIDDILAMPQAKEIADFQDYLPGGRRSSPAPVNFFWDRCQPGSDLFVKAEHPDLKDAIRKVHKAGGLAIIAHPYRTFYKQDALLEELIEAGVDGLEVYSNYHSPEQTKWYKAFAQNHGLLMSCGSDFHGEKKPDIEMGDYHMTEDGTPYLKALLEALQKNGCDVPVRPESL